MERTPKTQDVMGWKVAASLFLIATGAGSYLAGFLFGLMDPAGSAALSKLTVILGAPFVSSAGACCCATWGRRASSTTWFHGRVRHGCPAAPFSHPFLSV